MNNEYIVDLIRYSSFILGGGILNNYICDVKALTDYRELQKMQLSSIQTITFFHNCNNFSNSFFYEQKIFPATFLEILCSFVCSVRGPQWLKLTAQVTMLLVFLCTVNPKMLVFSKHKKTYIWNKIFFINKLIRVMNLHIDCIVGVKNIPNIYYRLLWLLAVSLLAVSLFEAEKYIKKSHTKS